jgi:hypothetical protein
VARAIRWSRGASARNQTKYPGPPDFSKLVGENLRVEAAAEFDRFDHEKISYPKMPPVCGVFSNKKHHNARSCGNLGSARPHC